MLVSSISFVTATWETYQNDLSNSGKANGTGYFDSGGLTSITDYLNGMDQQPVISDIDNNGKNEIIIFSGNYLKLFDNRLNLIDEKFVGTLQGQPTIYNMDDDNNLEIIFNANVSSASYLMAFEYNNGFAKQCNVSISNGLNGAGIKCADIGSTKSCFFKDQKNVFYNFNMSSCRQTANLTTNDATDTTPTVPSVLDYDNDGKLEGLWWFNNDSDAYMGIAVVELETMNFDNGFNNIGFVDDAIGGSSDFTYVPGYENVKGNPVFYQNDNAGGYEILIAWDNEVYFNAFIPHACFRSNLELFDTDGTLLWKNTPATGCPIGSTGTYNCDMSTPVTEDVDKDGYDDICFILEGDDTCYTNAPDDYFYCLDRFGNNVNGYPKNTSDVNKYGSYSADADTPMYVADMDNDGQEDMIGVSYIWNLNGTILKGNYSSFTAFAPVPVDVDNNGFLDLLGTKLNQTSIFKPNANTCTGRVQVQSVDSINNPVGNTNVFVNNVLKGTTDSFGLFESQQASLCGETLTYTVKCSDNSVACETKTTSLDFNGDFDSLQFDCSVCTGNADLKITLGNVNISADTNKVTVNVTIENIVANDVNLTIKAQDKTTEIISQENSVLFNISSGDKSIRKTLSLNLNNVDFIHVYVDANNQVSETNEKNNYVAVPVITDKIKAYVSVDTGNSYVDDAIRNYLNLFIIPTSQNDADLTIVVSLRDKNQLVKDNRASKNANWYADSSAVYSNGQQVGLRPYTGVVAPNIICIGCKYTVFAIGKDMDGVIASVKRLVNARTQFLSGSASLSQPSVIGDLDVLGISVFDIMHNDENKNNYLKNNVNFGNIVTKILNDNNFEVAIKTVKTYNDNTTLRLKNINSDFSANFKDAVIGNSKPVVLARGLWSNLLSWDSFGKELAFDEENARDTWLIEITGGPEQDEKANAPNYEYEDLVDYYWPALITGVQNYSGQKTLDYVGFSNGCRVALDSLKNWSGGKTNAGNVFDSATGNYILADLSANPIDTLVIGGCPGNFSELSILAQILNSRGKEIVSIFNKSNQNHVSFSSIAFTTPYMEDLNNLLDVIGPTELKILELFNRLGDKISINLFDYYIDTIQSDTDTNPGVGVSINNVLIYQGNFLFSETSGTDGIVAVKDVKGICKNINSSNKYYVHFPVGWHSVPPKTPELISPSLSDGDRVKSVIKEFINTHKVTEEGIRGLTFDILSTNQDCGPP